MDLEELDPSELGTKDYWEQRYEDECHNYKQNGDPGDVWFGENSIDRVVRWMNKSPVIEKSQKIVDLGCGNGMFLIELAKEGYTNLVGLDYSPKGIDLANAIKDQEDLQIDYTVSDIVNEEMPLEKYDVVHDKGTYDAISLSENATEHRSAYLKNVYRCLKADGVFIITSCNWTESELMQQFCSQFDLLEVLPTPKFVFGGKVGNVITSIILKKKKM